MLAALRRRIYEVLTNGNLEARKGCCRRWWLRPWARAANKLRPLFKVPALTSAVGFQRGSRDGRFVAYRVGPGDAIAFVADRPHTYRNAGRDRAALRHGGAGPAGAPRRPARRAPPRHRGRGLTLGTRPAAPFRPLAVAVESVDGGLRER